MILQKKIGIWVAAAVLVSCQSGSEKKKFNVSGIIRGSSAKMIYLEKVPASTMQPVIDDSATLSKDGRFTLHSDADESVVFNLRLDHSMYPVASVINDVKDVKLDVQLSKDNSQFAEKYAITGSPASQQMKDFMYAFNNELQKIYAISMQADSLQKSGAPDSLLAPLNASQQELAAGIKRNAEKALKEAGDPALILFELGYYQSTANGTGFGLPAMGDDEVNDIIATTLQRFPKHQATAAIKASIDQQAQRAEATSWVGKDAPDFTLPDVNGTAIKLSALRGKYVLVDFWASWCGPCRQENPNVVKAYEQYKDKNFTILGVSLDRPGEKDKWTKAVKDDKLPWTQVSDLQYWSSPVVALYKLEGIPFNVLVDPQGKVIGEGLRGTKLVNKLAEVLR